jgi:DNA polymerase-3 subunit alpha
LPQENKVNQLLLQAAKEYNMPIFCSTNVHYIDAEDKEAFEVAMAIKDGKRVYDEERRKTKGDFSLQSEDEVRAVCERNSLGLATINNMITTTQDIVNKIDITLPL